MKKQILALLSAIILLSYPAKGQISFKATLGVSYIEHFSIGGTARFSEKHDLSLLYGSDFFIRPNDFSSVMLQYNLQIPKLKVGNALPFIGIKAGYTIFTDEYYRWQVIALIPFIGSNYPVNEKLEFQLELGPAVSHEIFVKRIKYGEIGHYKKLLPEFKAGISYTIF